MGNLHRTEIAGVSAEFDCIYSFDGHSGFDHRASDGFIRGINSFEHMREESFAVESDGFLPEDIFVYFTARELLRLRQDKPDALYVFGRINPMSAYIISDMTDKSATLATDDAILANPDKLLTPRLRGIMDAVTWEEAAQFGLGDLKAVSTK